MAQKRTESCLWDLVLRVHSLAGAQAFPGGRSGTLAVRNSPSALSVHIKNHFRRLHISVLTAKNSLWHQLLVWPKAGAGFPCGGQKGWAAGCCCLPAGGKRGPLSPALMCLFPFSIHLPQERKQHGDGCLGLRQAIFRSKEARCSSDWGQFHLCKMQFQCCKLWEFNRALEDLNIFLKISLEATTLLLFSQCIPSSDKIKP